MSRLLICGVTLVVFAGCATGDSGAVFHDEVFQANPGSLVELLPAGDKPIHIGDNERWTRDIPDEHINPKAPLAYGWKFNLQQLPSKAGQLVLSMYSLESQWGCSTTVKINGKLVKDLSQLPYTGRGTTTIANLSVSKEYFRVGLNQLVIAEGLCSAAFVPNYNDSLIKSVLLVIW